ncbi:MAG: DUF2066 domain-containing protein [Alphaproteobacteria bacterium]|nr:DUF2066 domain-containing protein [Alphaproteobacteria bacterium]
MAMHRVLAWAMILAAAAAWPAAAQAPGRADLAAFTVSDVGVDETADSATQAKDLAIKKGQRVAFERLMQRLVGGEQRPPALDDAKIEELVQGFEVEQERRSGTRWIARMTYVFRPDPVRALLRGGGIEYIEAAGKPILLVPALEVAGGLALWDGAGAWRGAWIKVDAASRLQPIVMPRGDRRDQGLLPPDKAQALDEESLRALMGAYRTTDVALATAKLRRDLGSNKIALDVTVEFRGASGPKTMVQSFESAGEGEGAEAALLDAAVSALAARMETDFRREARIPATGPLARLAARAPVGGLQEWLRLRERLGGVAAIRRVDITAMSTSGMALTLHHHGDAQQLAAVLGAREIELVERDGFWTVRLRPATARP